MIGKARIGRTRSCAVAALAAALLCGTAGLARGETFLVSNLDDAGPGSLREAIEIANMNEGPDVITFAAELLGGSIGLTTSQLEISDDLTIEGPGADQLAISRTVAEPAFRVFYVGPGVTVEISGLSITGGYADFGGGIYNSGTLTLEGCVVSGNYAASYYDVSNRKGSGGGIYNIWGILEVSGCTISNNRAEGGYENSYADHTWGGGGIANRYGTLLVTNSTISGNDTSAGSGGGIFTLWGTSTTILNSTLSGNVACWCGGGIYTASDGIILNSTLTNNIAGAGGGVFTPTPTDWVRGWRVRMRNTIVAGNQAGVTRPDTYGYMFVSLGYNLIGFAEDSPFQEPDLVGGDYIGMTKKYQPIYTEPIDPKLAPLADNGGPTWTHALYLGSPGIDAGDPGFAPPPDTDQRGEGFPRVLNGRIDIGAFEGAIEPPPPPPLPPKNKKK